MYNVPAKYFFRLHHVRLRFKNEVESVLGYVAFCIAQIGKANTDVFKAQLCKGIRQYGINASKTQKTIDNWRTEIGAIFGMYIECPNGTTVPTQQTIDLANTSDLQAFFLGFVYSFQYPGGHIKAESVDEMLDAGISFHPYQWLFRAFLTTDLNTIDRCEFCHCVLNDMRVTRDHEPIGKTVQRIIDNRHNSETYNSEGDVVRYAADLLDYAVLAGLLNEHDGLYSLNSHNSDLAQMIAGSTTIYDSYKKLHRRSIQSIRDLEPDWFSYVNTCYQDCKTKANAIIESRHKAADTSELTADIVSDGKPHKKAVSTQKQAAVQENGGVVSDEPTSSPAPLFDGNVIAAISEDDTAKIGDYGENMILQHECLRVTNDGRKDLVHLIKRIPTHYAVGYDVKSIETDTEYDRFIEVKTTKSRKPLMFKQVHLTTNEWRTAQSSGDKYFIYRLMISEQGCKLFVIRDPVQKFKNNLITIIPRDGMDIAFTDEAGEEVELLCIH